MARLGVPQYLLCVVYTRRFFLVLLFATGMSSAFSLGLFEKPVNLTGTVIPHPAPAPDFTLADQHGTPFHLSDTRGKVVVMTFIYTHCTDLCPFVTLKLKSARDRLGADADKAVFVAVTTDPQRDTQNVVASYSRAAGLFDAWHFLTGPLPTVRDVWFNYGVGVDIEKPSDKNPPGAKQGGAPDEPEPTQGLSTDEATRARQIADQFGGGYEVSHSTSFWIIDRSGKIRASMDADALPSEIAANVLALMSR